MPLAEVKSNYKHKFELYKFKKRSSEFKKAIIQSLLSIAEKAGPDVFPKICLIQSSLCHIEQEISGSFKYVEENLL